jgi:hypothetical protein
LRPGEIDSSFIPLWVCYLIAGVLFLVVGGALAYAGKRQMDTMPGATETARALQDNVEWRINR